MTYELVKQLKAAGFPQKAPHCASCNEKCDYCQEYIPTLSELIEWCGRIDFKLRQTYSAYENAIFYVIEIPGDNDMERCDTPEEAVAKLGLALHEERVQYQQ